MSNPYEEKARLEKAHKIADYLTGACADPLQLLPHFSRDTWAAIAEAAGAKPPSAATCAKVREILEGRDAQHPTD